MSLLRKAKPDEIPQLVALSDSIFRGPHNTNSMGAGFPLMFAPDNADHLHVAEEDGKPVSLVGLYTSSISIGSSRIQAASMGSVCTDPDYRGKNFAGQLVTNAFRQLNDEEVGLLFISGDRTLYTRNDATHVSRVHAFSIPSDRLPEGGEKSLTVSNYEQGDLPGIHAVQQQESVYFERTEAEFAALIEAAAHLSCYPAMQHLLVGKMGDQATAYIVFGTWESEGVNYGTVIEFAGPDEQIITLMGEAAKRHSLPSLSITVPNYRRSLADRLASQGYVFQTQPILGTVRLINVPALWSQLQPYFAERLGAETAKRLICEKIENGYRVSDGHESLILDLRGVTHLILNGTTPADNSELKQALSRVFPLPFPNPNNLNYI